MKAFFRGEVGQLFPYGLFKSKQFSLLRLVAYAGISPMTPLLPFTSLGEFPETPNGVSKGVSPLAALRT